MKEQITNRNEHVKAVEEISTKLNIIMDNQILFLDNKDEVINYI